MIQIKADGVKYDPSVSSSQWEASIRVTWSVLTNKKEASILIKQANQKQANVTIVRCDNDGQVEGEHLTLNTDH